MITAMVAGYYEPNGNEIYPAGTDAYGEYCYGIQDMCSHMPCTFHGHPASVRMSSSAGPLPLQLPVPPGHLVQQVVDENGTLRHYLFSAHLAPLPPPHYSPSHASSAAPMATTYYPYPTPAYAPTPFPPAASHPLQPMSPQQGMHGTMMQPAQCNGQPTPHEEPSPPPAQLHLTPKDEKFQRPTYKFRRKADGRLKDKLALSSQSGGLRRDKRKYREKLDDSYRTNGSSASGSNASEVSFSDEEMTWIFSEYLSNLRPPLVSDLSPQSVLVCWKPPDLPSAELDPALSASLEQSEVTYEVLLCEKGKEGRYKTVYSGLDHHCNINALKPATEYYVCVQASLDDIRGSCGKGVTFKTPPAEPEAPQPPRLTARTRNSLTLKWNHLSDFLTSKAKHFVLEFDEGNQGYNRDKFVPVYTGLLKQYKVTKLMPSTGYKFRLGVVNEKGKSLYSEVCCYYTSGNAPSQPSPPVLRQAFINRLHLEWEKRNCDDDFSLQIEDQNTRHGFLTAYNGRETQFICSGLRGNTEYKFRLCASNEEGTSPWSRIVTYCTLPDKLSSPGKPNPKGRIHASCFRVSWDPPKDCKHSSITKYILEVDRGSGFEAVYTGPETEFFLDNLLPGTVYKLRVACITSAGHSPYSDVNSVTTAANSPGKCSLPKLQSKPEASFVCLDWGHPDHDGGSAVAEYEVDMTSPDNITQQVYKGPETSCIVNGLLPGRPYLFQVRAYNRVGAGPFSDPLEVVSGAGPPDAPKNLSASCDSPFSCLVSWEEPLNNGAAITAYQLQWSEEEDDESFSEVYEGVNLQYQVQGLTPATVYFFKVRAVNEAGHGPHSDTISCQTPASLPGGISAVSASPLSNAVYLSWPEPSSNGSPILSYNVELEGCLYNTEENVNEICLEDLTPETQYRIRVQAINDIGEGPFSEAIHVCTLKSPPDPPQLECTAVTHSSLRLRWNDKTDDDNVSFTVEMSSKSKSFVPVYHGAGGCCKVNRLSENTVYHFRICASSPSGQGPYSALYTFTTARAPPPSIKAPKVLSVSESSCQVEWFAAKYLPTTSFSYQLQLATSSTSDGILIYQGTDTKFTIEELKPNTHYLVRVACVRHCEDGEFVGNFSPHTAFSTLAVDVEPQILPTSSHSTSPRQRRTVSDKHLAALLVLLFEVFCMLVAALLEHFFCLSCGH